MDQTPVRVLGLAGSIRAGSTNLAALRTAAAAAPEGVTLTVYEGLATLPHFCPDDDREPLPPAVSDLRRRLASADALLVCTPEYAAALPGSFKNLLDWTVGGVETSGKPVGWINASSAPGGAAEAHRSLALVLTYTDARVVERACVRIPVTRAAVGADGLVADPDVRRRLREALSGLADHVRS